MARYLDPEPFQPVSIDPAEVAPPQMPRPDPPTSEQLADSLLALVPSAEINFRWEVTPTYANDPGSTLAKVQGWEPFCVVYEPRSLRPVIWWRRQAVGSA